jgi:ribonuclease BN (tRNA processing enzyme)
MKQILLSLLLLSSLYATKIEFEVLGSGGPELDGRASTSYLLWIDNKARLIVDMGSGSMLRFEESGAKIEDLEAVVLTHLHIDHSVELPSFIKAGYFSPRIANLDILAPDGNKQFPSTSEYLNALFGKKGAYRYMNDVLANGSDSFQIIPINVKDVQFTDKYKSFHLTLIKVHHGIVPSLALRIDIGDKSIVITGDTNNVNKDLELLAMDCNLLVAHHGIAEDEEEYATELHMKPSTIAHIAKEANVKKVLLTHRMKRTIGKEDKTLVEIKKKYKGEVVFAEDRMKLEI